MVTGNLAYRIDDFPSASDVTIDEAPIKWCSVTLSDVLNKGKRLEASVFDVEAKQARERISKGKFGTVPLAGDNGLIETAYYPGWMQRSRLKRIYCEKQYGEGFYLPSQITDLYPIPEKYISRLADCDMDELRLKENTLLLTRSGTIGGVSYVSRTLDGCVFSDDVIRITFKEEYDLGYVYTFLKSKVGNLILRTNGYGSVITHIEPGHLAELPIPNAPIDLRKRIHELIAHSYSLRDESNEMIDEATHLLIKELRLPPIYEMVKADSSVSAFSVKLSEMDSRLDASYHVPIVTAIIRHLEEYAEEVTTIGDSRISKDVILPSRFKRVYVDEGYGVVYFSGKNIKELDPSDKRYLSFSKHDKMIKKDLLINENMILVTCSGTIGNVTLVPKHWNGWAMTHDIIRYIPQDGIEGYSFIWLNTEYAKALLKSQAYGSVVQHIEKEHFLSIPIPILRNQNVKQKINSLALEANEKRYQAYRLEQDALRTMNKSIIFAQ